MKKLIGWTRENFRTVPKVPLLILMILFLAALGADFIAPHDPEIGNPRLRLLPPFWIQGGVAHYPLGTDTMGRDVLSRLIYGARISLVVAFLAVGFAGLMGTLVGVVAGYFGGWLDQGIMRLTDAWMSIPGVNLGILMAVMLGPSVSNLIIIMTMVFWSRYARVVRGETLTLKTRDFVNLAKVAGVSQYRIIFRHILPNVMNTVVTLASLQIGVVIVVEASLTFLGVGVPSPKPAWGLMLAEGRSGLLTGYYWLILFPGVAIALLVLSFNLLGDWFRMHMDPAFRNL